MNGLLTLCFLDLMIINSSNSFVTYFFDSLSNPLSFHDNLHNKITLLKTYRVESDYHNTAISDTQGKAALNLSVEIIELINQKI